MWYFSKVFYKASIITNTTNKATYLCGCLGYQEVKYYLYFGRINSNSSSSEQMSQYYSFFPHHMEFDCTEGYMGLLTYFEYFLQIFQSLFKWVSIWGKIIHIDFNTFIDQIRKYFQNFPLEGCRSITQAKWEDLVCKGPPWACQSCFILVFWGYMDLVIPFESIKEWK